MAFMEISTVPIGTGSTSLSQHVATVVSIIRNSGLPYKLHDMGTTVQGEASELFALATKLHEAMFISDIKRVYTVIKLDDRRDKHVSMGQKTKSVEEKL